MDTLFMGASFPRLLESVSGVHLVSHGNLF